MNERIFELAEQAGFRPIDVRNDDFKFKKFAESLIRECAEAGGQAVDRAEQYGIRSVSEYVDLKIKEHFGVE
jgi:hypothetical protein